MTKVILPSWIRPNLFDGKKFHELSPLEKEDLKNRLENFHSEDPDVSVVIPAWNEQDNIFKALSSLSNNQCKYKVEIIVINNNSTDGTQRVLDELGVRSFFQPEQGITFARQMGLIKARGKYHLCADSDTLYPPRWIELMVRPMEKRKGITGVYGRYAFIPPANESRLRYFIYEKITGIIIRIRKKNREYINVLGFTMGFITNVGRSGSGFEVIKVRKFDNPQGTAEYVQESEDGRMALHLMRSGKLKLVANRRAKVFTSVRRLKAGGGVFSYFKSRTVIEIRRMKDYFFKNKDKDVLNELNLNSSSDEIKTHS